VNRRAAVSRCRFPSFRRQVRRPLPRRRPRLRRRTSTFG
jgi:hypothetical protein